jgi:predicted dehydrogenase
MFEAPFRLGLVGAGAATRTLHLPGALASTRVALVALADPVTARAEKLAQDFGLSVKILSRLEDMLPLVDGVIIATPNDTHRHLALTCLTAGIPCLVEKPLATTVADATAMCVAAETSGKVLAVGYSTRFRDEVPLLRELLNAGYFGTIRRFHYQEGTIGGWSPLSGYTLDRKATGGGVLTVVGTHFIDRMLYWFGYPDTCSLADDAEGGPEAHCLANFRYHAPGGPFDGTLLLSKTVQLKAGLVIETERGDVLFPMGRSPLYFQPRDYPSVRTALTPRRPRKYPPEKSDSQLEIENFVAACRGEEVPMVDGRQGLLSVRLLNELYNNRSSIRHPSETASWGSG